MAQCIISDSDVYTASVSDGPDFTGRITYCFTLPPNIQHTTVTPALRGREAQWLPLSDGDTFRQEGTTLYVSLMGECAFTFITQDQRSVSTRFSHICEYHDNRRAAVVLSADDWNEESANHNAFLAATQACQKRQLWLTVAIVTGGISAMQWEQIRHVYTKGYVEPSSHSASHPGKAAYGNRLYHEVAGSRNMLLSNLPGSRVACWIEPSGYLDHRVAGILAKAGYLVSRSTQQHRNSYCAYTDYHCFLRAGITLMLEETDLDHANAGFERCLRGGGIYHAAMHPRLLDWSDNGWVHKHLDTISHHNDIWYTNLGELYRYRYTVQHALTLRHNTRVIHAPQPHWRQKWATQCVNFRMLLDRLNFILGIRFCT